MAQQTNVEVQLSGEDGNIFSIMGRVSRALKGAGFSVLAKEMSERVMSCESYDQALSVVQEYVEVQ